MQIGVATTVHDRRPAFNVGSGVRIDASNPPFLQQVEVGESPVADFESVVEIRENLNGSVVAERVHGRDTVWGVRRRTESGSCDCRPRGPGQLSEGLAAIGRARSGECFPIDARELISVKAIVRPVRRYRRANRLKALPDPNGLCDIDKLPDARSRNALRKPVHDRRSRCEPRTQARVPGRNVRTAVFEDFSAYLRDVQERAPLFGHFGSNVASLFGQFFRSLDPSVRRLLEARGVREFFSDRRNGEFGAREVIGIDRYGAVRVCKRTFAPLTHVDVPTGGRRVCKQLSQSWRHGRKRAEGIVADNLAEIVRGPQVGPGGFRRLRCGRRVGHCRYRGRAFGRDRVVAPPARVGGSDQAVTGEFGGLHHHEAAAETFQSFPAEVLRELHRLPAEPDAEACAGDGRERLGEDARGLRGAGAHEFCERAHEVAAETRSVCERAYGRIDSLAVEQRFAVRVQIAQRVDSVVGAAGEAETEQRPAHEFCG